MHGLVQVIRTVGGHDDKTIMSWGVGGRSMERRRGREGRGKGVVEDRGSRRGGGEEEGY